VRRQTLEFPSYKIVCGKYARVLVHPFGTSGSFEISVLLEKFPDEKGKFTGLRMTLREWRLLNSILDETLIPFVKAFHGESHEVEYDGAVEKKTGKPILLKNFFITRDIYVNTSVVPGGKCLMVDIRRFERLPSGDLRPLLSGITLSTGGLMYLWEVLRPKLTEGILMWESEEIQRVFSRWLKSFESFVDEEKEDQDDDQHMSRRVREGKKADNSPAPSEHDLFVDEYDGSQKPPSWSDDDDGFGNLSQLGQRYSFSF
jgi:hypothetical protein